MYWGNSGEESFTNPPQRNSMEWSAGHLPAMNSKQLGSCRPAGPQWQIKLGAPTWWKAQKNVASLFSTRQHVPAMSSSGSTACLPLYFTHDLCLSMSRCSLMCAERSQSSQGTLLPVMLILYQHSSLSPPPPFHSPPHPHYIYFKDQGPRFQNWRHNSSHWKTFSLWTSLLISP